MHSRRGLLIALAVVGFAVPGVAQAGPSQGDALVFRAANGDLKIFDSGSAKLVRTVAPGVVSPIGNSGFGRRALSGAMRVPCPAGRTRAASARRANASSVARTPGAGKDFRRSWPG